MSETAESAATDVRYSQSAGLPARLAQFGASVAFTSYQSGFLYTLGRTPEGGLHLHRCAINKPMGLCFDPQDGLTLAAGIEVMRMPNVLRPDQRVEGMFDACFVPRRVHMTGALDAHDIGVLEDGQPIFVNTQFNCLATVDPRQSFRAIWTPPFISALVKEDRCHLNGLAMDGHRPAYVTAVSRSNSIDGWRDRRGDGGVIVDVEANRIICSGLSMPHSPRLHQGQLWVLNSGTGELGTVEIAADGEGRFVPRVFCPGFLRGLAFIGNYAIVGLSKPRYERFEGLALDERLRAADSTPWCGLQIIDLTTMTCVDWFRMDGAIAELYDVAVLPGITCAMTLGPTSAEVAALITYDP